MLCVGVVMVLVNTVITRKVEFDPRISGSFDMSSGDFLNEKQTLDFIF